MGLRRVTDEHATGTSTNSVNLKPNQETATEATKATDKMSTELTPWRVT
jgi:hypothetical protein